MVCGSTSVTELTSRARESVLVVRLWVDLSFSSRHPMKSIISLMESTTELEQRVRHELELTGAGKEMCLIYLKKKKHFSPGQYRHQMTDSCYKQSGLTHAGEPGLVGWCEPAVASASVLEPCAPSGRPGGGYQATAASHSSDLMERGGVGVGGGSSAEI